MAGACGARQVGFIDAATCRQLPGPARKAGPARPVGGRLHRAEPGREATGMGARVRRIRCCCLGCLQAGAEIWAGGLLQSAVNVDDDRQLSLRVPLEARPSRPGLALKGYSVQQ